MSQEETNEYFDFERKKHNKFFLPFYQRKNWIVNKDNINGKNPIDWDVELEIFAGKFITIDEKARQGEFDDCLIEIIQDIAIQKLGWLFGKKDFILYGSWKNPEEIYPSSLYMINSEKLKKYIYGLDGIIKTCISKKGWGITWNIVLDWKILLENNIATKLIL